MVLDKLSNLKYITKGLNNPLFVPKVLEYGICLEEKTMYEKIIEDIRWSIRTLFEICRYKLEYS